MKKRILAGILLILVAISLFLSTPVSSDIGGGYGYGVEEVR